MEREILALAGRQADRAEVFVEESDRTMVEFRAGRLHSQETRRTNGYGLRIAKDGRIGFSSTTNPERLDLLVEAALETARFGREALFSFPKNSEPQPVKTFDNRVMLVPAKRMVEWGEDIVRAMAARDKDLRLDLTFSRSYRECRVANSRGLTVGYEQAGFGLHVTALLVSDGLVWLSRYVNLANGEPLDIEPVCDWLERQARHARERAKMATGEYPVLVMPTALRSMLSPLGVGVNGKQREKGSSPLIGREGEQVLDERLTIADNPLRDFGSNSGQFDGEGTASRKNVLFDRGRFGGFLFDLETAAACEAETTGSARRPYSQPPRPGTSNLDVEPGDGSLEDTIAGMKRGLLVHDFIGGGQSNVMAGNVTLNVSTGFMVENGETVGRVKDAMVAGNVYEMLASVGAVGSESEDLGSFSVPFLYFPSLKVAARD